MRIGLGLGLGFGRTGTPVPPAFDPASLALTLFLDGANYNATTGLWTGKASAGTSGSHNATSDTHDPTAGATLNGIQTVSFARASSQRLLLASTPATYFAAGAWAAWALVNISSIDTNSGSYYSNDCVFADTGAGSYFNIGMRSTGPKHGVDQYGSGDQVAAATFATGAWQLLQWRYDGTNLSARTDAGSWTSIVASNAQLGHGTSMVLGCNYNKTAFINGLVASIGASQSFFDDATFENIRAAMNSRFALSL